MPRSKVANFFRRFYRISCVGFSSLGGEHGLVYYTFENREAMATAVSFHMRELYRDKSYNAFL